MWPTELKFARKIRSVFDKLFPKEKKKKQEKKKTKKTNAKLYIPDFFKECKNRKEIWKAGIIDKHIRRITYIIKEVKKTIKRHHDQMRKRYSDDINNQKEEPMKVIYDLFDVLMPLVTPDKNCPSKRKRTFSGTIEIKLKRKKYNFQRKY